MQLVAVELESLDKLLHGPFRLEGEKREAECNVSPLAGVVDEEEALAELLDDVLRLLLLRAGEDLARA